MKIFKGLVFLLFAASLLMGEEAILPVCPIKSSVSDLGATIISADLPGNPETAVTIAFGGGVSGEGNLLGSGLAFTMTEWLRRKLDQERLKPDCAFSEAECEVILERDAVFVVVTGLKEQVKAAVKKIFEIVREKAVDDEEFAKLKKETVAYLKNSESEEKNALINLWRRTAFPAMMEAVPKCGYSAQAEKLEKEDLEKYLAAHFVSGNVSFVLVGSLFGSGLEELAGECLATLPEGIFIRDDRVLVGDDGSPRLSMKTASGEKSLVCLGVTMRPTARDKAASCVLANLLEKGVGELEKKLAEEFQRRVEVSVLKEKELGGLSLNFICETRPEERQRVQNIMRDYLRSFAQRKYSEEEVREEADQLLTELAARCARPTDLSKMLSRSALEKRGPFALNEDAKAINELKADQLKSYAERSLAPSCITLCWSDPEEKIEPRAAEFLRLEREILENIGHQSYRRQLPGQAEVLFQRREDETIVRCAFVSLGGNWYEESFNNGIFAVMSEFLASGGSESQAFSKALKECGAKIEPINEPQVVGFEAVVPARHFSKLLPYLCRSWGNPKFNESAVGEAVKKTLARSSIENTNSIESAEMLMRTFLFGTHPFAYDRFGNPFVLERIKAKDVASFYGEFVTPDNTEIIVSGPCEEKAVLMTIHSEMKDFLTKGNARIKNLRRGERPRLLPDCVNEIETKETEKTFYAPEGTGMAVIGTVLPGFEKDPVMPYLISYALRRPLSSVLPRLREKYGNQAVLGSGFKAYQGYALGYAFVYLKTKADLIDECSQMLFDACAESRSNLLDPEKFGSFLNAAADSSALYSRSSEDFVRRAAVTALFTTNDFGDLAESIRAAQLPGVSNSLSRVGDLRKVIVKPAE